MHSGGKDACWKSPLFLCRGPGVPSPSRLCPAFDEWRHSEWGLHHLPPWRGQPEAAGVLRHDHGRGRLDRKYTRCSPGVRTSGVQSTWRGACGPSFTVLCPSLVYPRVCLSGALHCPQSRFSAAWRGRERDGMWRLQWPAQGGGCFCSDSSRGGAGTGTSGSERAGSCLLGTAAIIKQ